MFPSFVVDITVHFDQWIAALKCHKSQFLNPEKRRDYMWSLETMARSFGQQAGCKYGQGFYNVEPIKIVNMLDLIREEDHF